MQELTLLSNMTRKITDTRKCLFLNQGRENIPSSGFENLLRLLAQATDILAALTSNASNITLGFSQSSPLSTSQWYCMRCSVHPCKLLSQHAFFPDLSWETVFIRNLATWGSGPPFCEPNCLRTTLYLVVIQIPLIKQ